MKKGVKQILIIIATIGIIAFLFFTDLKKQEILLSPDATIVPPNCSNSNIISTWNSIFDSDTPGTILTDNVITAGTCNKYLAYKISSDDVYILSGIVKEELIDYRVNSTKIYAMHALANTSFKTLISSLTNITNASLIINSDGSITTDS